MSGPSRHPRPVTRQAAVLVVGLVLWSLAAEPAPWALVAAYAGGWLVVNALVAWRPGLLDLRLGRWQAAGLAVLVVAAPATTLWRAGPDLLDAEGLVGIEASTADRVRLEATPSIAPPVVHTDHPQVFYVHAPGARSVTVQLGPAATRLEAVDLGHGLFRVGYDPIRDGAPLEGDAEGEAQAVLEVDGSRATRALTVVRPLAHPRWPCLSADRTLAAAPSEETDQVVVFDADGLVRVVDTGDGPTDCAFTGPDRLLVTHRFDDALWLVDARSGERLADVALARTQVSLAVSPDGARAVVALGGARPGLFTVPLAGGTPAGSPRFAPLEHAPDWIAFGPDPDTLVVSTRRPAALLRLARSADDGWTPRGEPLLLGRPAVTLARSPDGARVVVSTTDFRPDGRPHLGNHFVQDQLLTVDVARWRVTTQELTARRTPRQRDAGDIDRGVSPMGIDLLPGGRRLVAFAGTSEVWTLRPDRARPVVTPLDDVPLAAPHGVVALAGDRFAVTSPSEGTVGLFRDNGSLATLVRLTPDDDALLADRPEALRRRLGEEVFYESTRSGVSCQSCHLHTGTDGAMHNIGEHRLAPTLTARGIAGTAPYLRDGSFPRVRDLIDGLSHTLLRGFLRAAPSRRLTLEAYVESLARPPTAIPPADRDLARERRGVDAFVRARCDTCHTFPAFTNLGQHPLATVFPDAVGDLPADAWVDTPSLLSVRHNPPYLVDGRAATLEAVLEEHNDANRHGDTAALDDDATADLLYFLETL